METHQAEKRKESALTRNAHSKPSFATATPPVRAPMVRVVHWVVWVRVFAAWRSVLSAIAGRIAERPLVKKGDANIRSALRA